MRFLLSMLQYRGQQIFWKKKLRIYAEGGGQKRNVKSEIYHRKRRVACNLAIISFCQKNDTVEVQKKKKGEGGVCYVNSKYCEVKVFFHENFVLLF